MGPPPLLLALLGALLLTRGAAVLEAPRCGRGVVAVRTPITPAAAVNVLRTAYASVMGQTPTQLALQLLVGQAALETAHFQKLYDWNFGNITSAAAGCTRRVEVTDPRMCYAAYPDADTGARALAMWWKRRGIVPPAPADVASFGAALQRGNYLGSAASAEKYQQYAATSLSAGSSYT